MKTNLILIGIIVLLLVISGLGIEGCHRHKQEAADLETKLTSAQNLLANVRNQNDSLRNEAAKNCDDKIQQALQNLKNESNDNRPVKPAIFR